MNILQNLIHAEIAGKVIVLSVAIVCDILTGVIKAIMAHDLKSSKFKTGLLKKAYDYILIVVGCCLDYLLKVNYISLGCVYSLIAMEFYSCIENLREYLPIPDSVSKALDVLSKKED